MGTLGSNDARRAPRRLSFRKKLLFSALAVMLLAGLAEITLRLLIPRLSWSSARIVWDGGVDLRPDQSEWPPTYPKSASGVQAHVEFDVPVSYNSDGFRGPDFYPDRGPVVIVVGDSTTAGHGVAYDDMFTSRLERALQARFRRLQVWNIARGGSGTVVHVRLLDRILAQYASADVKAVVLITCVTRQNAAGNDLTDLQPFLPFLNGGRPEAGPAKKKRRLISLLRMSSVLHGAEAVLSRWRRETVRLPELNTWDQLWQDYYRCLERAHELCAARGVAMLVVGIDVFPSDRRSQIDEIENRFQAFLEPRGRPFVMCAPQVSQLSGQAWFYPIDGHPNALAHAYFADMLLEPITELLESTGMPRRPD